MTAASSKQTTVRNQGVTLLRDEGNEKSQTKRPLGETVSLSYLSCDLRRESG